jgi:hypothetical protein
MFLIPRFLMDTTASLLNWWSSAGRSTVHFLSPAAGFLLPEPSIQLVKFSFLFLNDTLLKIYSSVRNCSIQVSPGAFTICAPTGESDVHRPASKTCRGKNWYYTNSHGSTATRASRGAGKTGALRARSGERVRCEYVSTRPSGDFAQSHKNCGKSNWQR